MTSFSTKTLAAAFLAATMLSSAAYAADANATGAMYIAGQAGYNNPVGDSGLLDNTVSFAGAVGYRVSQNLRVEGELSHRKNDYSTTALGPVVSGDSKGTALMANAWYDFANSTAFTPYLGGGIGFAHGSLTATGPGGTAKVSDNALAWQLGGGMAYNVTANVALTADYRYLDTAEFDDIGDDYRAHEIRAGVRYSF